MNVDLFVRAAGLRAMGTLCFDGRIDRETFAAFLCRLDDEKLLTETDDVLWDASMRIIGALGMAELTPRVRAAFADERIPSYTSGEEGFDRMLREAWRGRTTANASPRRRWARSTTCWPSSDLPVWNGSAAELYELLEEAVQERAAGALALYPIHNPYRGVGRNDPCPCGSGKKFKKCCLPRSWK